MDSEYKTPKEIRQLIEENFGALVKTNHPLLPDIDVESYKELLIIEYEVGIPKE